MTTGEQLRDAGIDAARTGADNASPNWSSVASQYLMHFVRKRVEFRAEDVRRYALEQGFPEPKDGRAWGGVFRNAAKANLIKRIGYKPCTDPKSHAAPVSVWIAA